MLSKVPEVPKKHVPEKKVAVTRKEVSPPAKGTASFESGLLPVLYYCSNF